MHIPKQGYTVLSTVWKAWAKIKWKLNVGRDHEGLSFLDLKPHPKPAKYLLCDSRAVLVKDSQAQKCLRINSKPCTKLLWNFKNSYLTKFSNDGLTDYLTDQCLQTSITQKWLALQVWLLHRSSLLRPEVYLFTNRSSYNVCIMVIPMSYLFLLCVLSLLHNREDDHLR